MPGRVRFSKQDDFYTALLVTGWKVFFLRKCFSVLRCRYSTLCLSPLTYLILRPLIMSCLKKQMLSILGTFLIVFSIPSFSLSCPGDRRLSRHVSPTARARALPGQAAKVVREQDKPNPSQGSLGTFLPVRRTMRTQSDLRIGKGR